MISLEFEKPIFDYFIVVLLFAFLHYGSRSLSGTEVTFYKLLVDFYGLVLGNIIFIIPLFFWYKLSFLIGLITLPIALIIFWLAGLFFYSQSRFIFLKVQALHLLNWFSFIYIIYKLYKIFLFDY